MRIFEIGFRAPFCLAPLRAGEAAELSNPTANQRISIYSLSDQLPVYPVFQLPRPERPSPLPLVRYCRSDLSFVTNSIFPQNLLLPLCFSLLEELGAWTFLVLAFVLVTSFSSGVSGVVALLVLCYYCASDVIALLVFCLTLYTDLVSQGTSESLFNSIYVSGFSFVLGFLTTTDLVSQGTSESLFNSIYVSGFAFVLGFLTTTDLVSHGTSRSLFNSIYVSGFAFVLGFLTTDLVSQGTSRSRPRLSIY
jgi:hypothetical protein